MCCYFVRTKHLFLILLYSSLNFALYGQELKGVIFEKNTNTPLAGAHIYVINSLNGTVSNVEGSFKLDPPNAYGELLITYVGYIPQKIEFTPSSTNLKISLIPDTNQLEEIAVKSTEDKKWKRLYKKFESSFLGNTKNASLCVITNPWVVDITKGQHGELVAKSKQPIEIINGALGYKLTFYLTDFTLKGDRLHYQGFVYFDEIKSKTSSETKRWIDSRKETYLGSKTHFINALKTKNLEAEGFEIYLAELSPGIGFTTKMRKNESALLKKEHELSIPNYLKVVYTKAEPQSAYITNNQSQQSFAFQGPKADLVPKGNLQMSSQDMSTQISYLYSRNSKLKFTDSGYIINNKHIVEYGYWSWLGVAEMLPFEYDYLLNIE